MDLPLNRNTPTIMHIDLNSCFATCEQQANPLLRGKPVAVAAYTTPNGCIISPSIEAKNLGIKVGMRVRDAKLLCKEIIVLLPDPPKYRNIHLKFCRLFRQYSPNVIPKSIDEAIIDFDHTPALKRGLVEIAKEIKSRMKEDIGDWILCNIGIATNRFLAKLAASLHKPDGLDVVTYQNLRQVYARVSLTDLNGINTRYQARLNTYGIFTPLDFLHAKLDTLKHQVFKSICGYYWYLRLRGWEIDAVDFSRKSFGQTYSLGEFTKDPKVLGSLLMKLTEKMGRRLRKAGYSARGIHVAFVYNDYTHWHHGHTYDTEMYTTQELYKKVIFISNTQPEKKVVTRLAISCFHLTPRHYLQQELFETDKDRKRRVSDAVDKMNDRFGEFVITPALMMGMDDLVTDRIAFGNVKELEDLYRSG